MYVWGSPSITFIGLGVSEWVFGHISSFDKIVGGLAGGFLGYNINNNRPPSITSYWFTRAVRLERNPC